MSNPVDTAAFERLARIEVHLEKIAVVLEKTTQDHETRLRALEQKALKQDGLLGFIRWVGAPALVLVAALLVGRVNLGS